MNAFKEKKYLISIHAKITIKSVEKYFFLLDIIKKKDITKIKKCTD